MPSKDFSYIPETHTPKLVIAKKNVPLKAPQILVLKFLAKIGAINLLKNTTPCPMSTSVIANKKISNRKT